MLTEAPATWRSLVRQRRLWWAGSFRHSIVNFDNNILRAPIWAFYYAGLVWCGIYLRSRGALRNDVILMLGCSRSCTSSTS